MFEMKEGVAETLDHSIFTKQDIITKKCVCSKVDTRANAQNCPGRILQKKNKFTCINLKRGLTLTYSDSRKVINKFRMTS